MVAQFLIDPMGAPRQTRADTWRTDLNHPDPRRRQRPVIARYRAFQNSLREQAQAQVFTLTDQFSIDFWIAMPASWSRTKREAMFGTPHRQKPDVDNLFKAVTDCLMPDDAAIWATSISKRWGTTGIIVIETAEDSLPTATKRTIDTDSLIALAGQVRRSMEEDGWTFDDDTGEVTPPHNG